MVSIFKKSGFKGSHNNYIFGCDNCSNFFDLFNNLLVKLKLKSC